MPHIKIALLVYVFIYYGFLLALRSWLLYKNTGINPIKNLSKKGMAGFIENVFLVCFILVSAKSRRGDLWSLHRKKSQMANN